MIKVFVKKEISCGVSAAKIKETLSLFLKKEGVFQDVDISVALVGETKMISLAKKYLKEENTVHNVLSFPYSEGGGFIYPPGKVKHLGDIIVCYPKALGEAESEGLETNEKVLELICHGALHLMGKHHD